MQKNLTYRTEKNGVPNPAYSTVLVPRLMDARPAGWVTYCSICASTMPRGQNRAGKGSILYYKDDPLSLSSYYLSMTGPHYSLVAAYTNLRLDLHQAGSHNSQVVCKNGGLWHQHQYANFRTRWR